MTSPVRICLVWQAAVPEISPPCVVLVVPPYFYHGAGGNCAQMLVFCLGFPQESLPLFEFIKFPPQRAVRHPMPELSAQMAG